MSKETAGTPEHTREPWYVTESKPYRIMGAALSLQHNSPIIANLTSLDLDNASRIVACVNYCVGQETKKLESDYAQGYNACDQVAALTTQRDEAKQELALKEIVRHGLENRAYAAEAELDAAKRALAELQAAIAPYHSRLISNFAEGCYMYEAEKIDLDALNAALRRQVHRAERFVMGMPKKITHG